MDLHWTPQEFWAASVPEFWAAVDFMAERNLDAEEDLDAIRTSSGRAAPAANGVADEPVVARHKGGAARVDASGRVSINPHMSLSPRPDWFAWREQVRLQTGY